MYREGGSCTRLPPGPYVDRELFVHGLFVSLLVYRNRSQRR